MSFAEHGCIIGFFHADVISIRAIFEPPLNAIKDSTVAKVVPVFFSSPEPKAHR